jgi:biopolymer transport protein ExbD
MDAAPFATVLFLLVLFLLLSLRVYTPGIRLRLPVAGDLPGTDKPTIAVAVDSRGRLYYENQLISESHLRTRLREAAKAGAQPLTLLLQADQAVTYERLVGITMLAREAGINEAWLATLPRPLATSP